MIGDLVGSYTDLRALMALAARGRPARGPAESAAVRVVGAGRSIQRVGPAGAGGARIVGQRPVVQVRRQRGWLVGGDLGATARP